MKPKSLRSYTIRPVENGFTVRIEWVGKVRMYIAKTMTIALEIIEANYTELMEDNDSD